MPLLEQEQVRSHQQKDYKIEPWSTDRLFDKLADTNNQQEPTEDFSTQLRDPNVIASELMIEQQRAGKFMLKSAIIQGKLLNEAKAQVKHNEWLSWINSFFWKGDRTANTYMRLAREYPNPQSTSDLDDLTIAMAEKLLDVPFEKRTEFLDCVHDVKGRQKRTREMSDRDFNKLVSALYPKKYGETANDLAIIEAEGTSDEIDDIETECYKNDDPIAEYVDSVGTDNEAVTTEAVSDDDADLVGIDNEAVTAGVVSYDNADPENVNSLNTGIEVTNTAKIHNADHAENTHTESIKATEDINYNTLETYERHVKTFDDCINNVRSNLNKMFEAREICQDKPEIRNRFNNHLISMFEIYLNILGYTIKPSSEEFTPQTIHGLEEITDIDEIAS